MIRTIQLAKTIQKTPLAHVFQISLAKLLATQLYNNKHVENVLYKSVTSRESSYSFHTSWFSNVRALVQ
jgi:hypothetical protein